MIDKFLNRHWPLLGIAIILWCMIASHMAYRNQQADIRRCTEQNRIDSLNKAKH